MNKRRPKVAIITRTRDRIMFLERAIQSVYCQTMDDFIHVIINDSGDPDKINALIHKYHDRTRGRVRVVHNTESRGMEAASNKAIKSVDSEYIAIHDDDDTWHKDFLKEAIAKIESADAMGVVVRADKVTERILAGNNTIEQLKIEPWMPDLKVVNLYKQCIDNQMTPITFLYNRTAYDELRGYDESLPVLGDWDFGIRFLLKYDVEFLDKGYPLAFYHHRKFSTDSQHNNSFGEGTERHRYWSNRLMNKYLRQELAEGRLGVGYIMNDLRYNQSNLAMIAKRVLPNFVIDKLKKRVQN